MLALCGVGGPGALGAPAEVHVPATATCVSTGLFVRAGDTLTLTAAGEWTMWRGTYPRVGAEGHSFKAGPLGGWGRLCARIGTGPEVAVPLKQRWTADRTGPLFLFANAGNYGRDKAEGELDVQVEGGIPLADYLSQARAHGTEITVPASASCVDTGVFLQAGEAFTIDAVGTWTMATDNANYTTDAEGAPLVRFRDRRLGQLLCRIGGVPGPAQTPLGMHAEMRAPTSGILYLSPNSLWWLGTRNQGTLSVIIQGGQKASASLRTREKSAELDALRERILARCNELRARMGLPPVQRLASLERAAQGHAEYLDRNNVRGHVQEAGQPGFTGKSAGERLRAAGYDGAGGEVVAYEETAEQGFDLWVASVYHRQFATHPALQSIGLGVCGRVQVIDYAIASSPRTHAVACLPAGRAEDVPLSWNGLESPSPLPPGAPLPVGYTVSAHFPDALRQVNEAILTGPGDTPVPCYTLHRLNDANLRGSDAVFLVPRAPLEPGVTYHAAIAVQTAAGEERAAWAFTTAPGARSLVPVVPEMPAWPVERNCVIAKPGR